MIRDLKVFVEGQVYMRFVTSLYLMDIVDHESYWLILEKIINRFYMGDRKYFIEFALGQLDRIKDE